MNKFLIALAILAFFLIGFGIWQSFKKSPTAKINNHEFKLQIAKTPKDKEIGLSKYKSLAKDIGMLFPFEKPDYYSFWMKKMKFPIDIIYIRDGKIVTIYKSAQPPKKVSEGLLIYKPKEPSNMVLEINAGLSNKYKLKEGDKVNLNNI
ncbi:MAG: hypothetical protein A2860_01385 [Candidatus Levybacteria bacterium RIFCSPHIGHO2_01_FULL_37_33]|nr:MAG: hypothetical protein A2860_01385 [Candidatus Levybacteria bacterium RIFCSPHIGHO2_01_FULL_37_33]OGH30073.1 MAG: hypothetical protein A3F30_03675 [Candidatus Levybacteria bacterium RIFCSPHIGHO2_12_FULL_37_12]OGH33086.1 MAG: hypothetical protein A2953_03310 [Candidatus Levybacteria bacterium RIFCSPLOWO2_01_FULL_36_54]